VGQRVISSQYSQVTGQRSQLVTEQQELALATRQLHASCGFWRSIAPIPVVAAGSRVKPSLLGVAIVLEARAAYAGQHCGTLPPADPSLITWAHYYHLNVP
jgi:hypothetical protein